jgi:mono/diheme cytochrome c family protein
VIQRTVVALLAALFVPFLAAAQDDGPLPEGPGVDLVYAKCQQCHPISYTVNNAGLPDFLWADTLDLMKQLGMDVTAEEEEILLDYLTTYLGTEPPPEPPAETEAQADTEVDGAAVYMTNCASCHGQNGEGIPGAFPPLAQHAADLAAADRAYPILTLLYGLNGEIVVEGASYNGAMPAWPQLSDAEIAAVLNHVTAGWDEEGVLGDDFAPYAADEVAERRGEELSTSDVYEARPSDLP